MTSETNIYAERAVHTAELRGHFVRHIDHMTRESLHYKSDIAAELAFRDAEIDRLRNQVNTLTDALCGITADYVARFDNPAMHEIVIRARAAIAAALDANENTGIVTPGTGPLE